MKSFEPEDNIHGVPNGVGSACECQCDPERDWDDEDDLEAEYEDALNAFIKTINSDVTVGCALPFNVPSKEIKSIIDQAFRFFVREHGDYTFPESLLISGATMRKWVHQQGVEKICTPRAQRRRGKLLLPPDVEYVDGVYDLSRNFGETGGSRYMGGVAYTVPQRFGINSQYALADCAEYATCMLSFSDIVRMITIPPVSTTFNPINKTLYFTGHIPVGAVVVCVRSHIDKIDAFNDDLFFRYCVCMCKLQLGEILERYNYTLPGNITLKSPADTARTELEKLIEEIRQYNTPQMLVM